MYATVVILLESYAVPIGSLAETRSEAKFIVPIVRWLGDLADKWVGKLGGLKVIAGHLDLDNELDILTDTLRGLGDGADKLAEKIREGKKIRRKRRRARKRAREAAS